VPSACSQCGQATGLTLFCDGCGVLNSAPHAAAYRPGKVRALAAGLIDLVIIIATLGVGWLVLLNFTAPNSETPGGRSPACACIDWTASRHPAPASTRGDSMSY
jgi:hypothetical protein